jgi:transcriptional regulator with XRE-family HTH domain
MNIGERLKEVRKSLGYKLREVGAAAGVDPKMYQHYEAGRCRVPVEVLLSLSEFYGYNSIDKLLGLIVGPAQTQSKLVGDYMTLSPEKRKIVDYILSLKD